MPTRFKATPYTIGSRTVVRLPKAASAKLPSRGMVMAETTFGKKAFALPLEPDGNGSHWFEVTKALNKATGVKAGKEVSVVMESLDEWPEPAMPADIKKALFADAIGKQTWKEITSKARWDWIRWIRSTNNPDTRAKRIKVTLSKMHAGSKRPCCFNRNMCTDMEVSKGGVLKGKE